MPSATPSSIPAATSPEPSRSDHVDISARPLPEAGGNDTTLRKVKPDRRLAAAFRPPIVCAQLFNRSNSPCYFPSLKV